MDKKSSVCVLGGRGLVGSSLIKKLEELGFENLLSPSSQELDLCNQNQVQNFFAQNHIDYLFVCAGKVGGILANSQMPFEFLYQNAMIAMNSIHAAITYNVKKTLYLGSSCIYPKFAEQPIPEEALLTGVLESSNEGYALAKISGIKLCEYAHKQLGKNFISAMPCNLYGPRDNYHPSHSHVIPGLLRRFHEAKISRNKTVTIWGSGNPLREFLFVDDLARALILLMEKYEDSQHINVGSGKETSIRELAHAVKEAVGFDGAIVFDASKPDGTPRKIMRNSKIENLGWSPEVELRVGLKKAYEWALENHCFEASPNLKKDAA